jgi:hypothetical protein
MPVSSRDDGALESASSRLRGDLVISYSELDKLAIYLQHIEFRRRLCL